MFRLEEMNRSLILVSCIVMCVALTSCTSRDSNSLPKGNSDTPTTDSVTSNGGSHGVPTTIPIESLSCHIVGEASGSLRGENLAAAHQLLREWLSVYPLSKSFRGIQTEYHLAACYTIVYYKNGERSDEVYCVKIFGSHAELCHGKSGASFLLNDLTKNELLPFLIACLSEHDPDAAEKIYRIWQWKATEKSSSPGLPKK